MAIIKYIFVVISALFASAILMGCITQHQQEALVPQNAGDALSVLNKYRQSLMLPKAVIYKTNGDYCNNVMVNVNASHSALTYYPAISDISANSAPVEVCNGWLLDRQGGIDQNSVFLKYTYDEYAALQHTPSPKELMSNIIPGSGVTKYRTLPITVAQAMADPELVKQYTVE